MPIDPATEAKRQAEAERVQNLSPFEVEMELTARSTENELALGILNEQGANFSSALDVLYLKTCIEHLIGAYEIPRVRLRFQIAVSELIESVNKQLARARLLAKDDPRVYGN